MRDEYDFSEGRRGAVVRAGGGKTRITILIDDDVLEWFRRSAHAAGGGSYQAMMYQALREHMEHQVEPLEETLRRVLREVLPSKKAKAPKRAAKARAKKASRKRRA